MRGRTGEAAEQVDPRAAEVMLRAAALGDGSDAELDDKVVIQTQFLLLAALIADEQLDEAGLDASMAESRALVDDWLG